MRVTGGIHWVFKIGWNRNPTLRRQRPDVRTPAMRYPVALPHVNSLAGERTPRQDGQTLCDLCPVAQCLDEISMLAHDAPNISRILRCVKPVNYGDDQPNPRAKNSGMAKRTPKEARNPTDVACGRRLRMARKAVGWLTMRDMAAKLWPMADDLEIKQAVARIGTYENGDVMVPPELIRSLERLKGIDANYIYLNRMDRLPEDVQARILEMEADGETHIE